AVPSRWPPVVASLMVVRRLHHFLTTSASSRCSTECRRAGATRTPSLARIICTPVTKQTPHHSHPAERPQTAHATVARLRPLVFMLPPDAPPWRQGRDPRRLESAVGQSLGRACREPTCR